jgi:hypothetical protein
MVKAAKALSMKAVLQLQKDYYFVCDWAYLSEAVVLAEVKKITKDIPTTRPGQISLLAQHHGVQL